MRIPSLTEVYAMGETKRGRGRPIKLTDEAKAEFIEMRTSGLSLEDCCAYIGLSYATVKRHLAEDEDFRAKLNRSTIKARAKLMKRIAEGGKGWPGANRFLALSCPTQYSDAAIQRQVEKLDQEENALDLDAIDELPDV